jgi:F-type H+-transporting ATPase subunit epsilon
VHNNRVTVIVESAEHKDDIDLDRALAAKKRAEERLATARESKLDIARAEAALKRAINRIKLAQN